jgi:hypothetical protein
MQGAQWLERQQARLLSGDYYHGIFTIPRELNPLWLTNGREVATHLFHAAWETLSELLGDPKYLREGVRSCNATQAEVACRSWHGLYG